LAIEEFELTTLPFIFIMYKFHKHANHLFHPTLVLYE
jgi:hypothetical protein